MVIDRRRVKRVMDSLLFSSESGEDIVDELTTAECKALISSLRSENISLRAEIAAYKHPAEHTETEEELSDYRQEFFTSLPESPFSLVRSNYGPEFFKSISSGKRRVAALCLLNYCTINSLPPECLWSNIAANEFYLGDKK